jgi:hypothetical protein
MRHDKASFAREAIRSAQIAKKVGDYVRILYFTGYARALSADSGQIKKDLDPFTGCFISRIPETVAALRFTLSAAALSASGKPDQAAELIQNGCMRIQRALACLEGTETGLGKAFKREKKEWDLYYDILDRLEAALKNSDPLALSLMEKGRRIMESCALKS